MVALMAMLLFTMVMLMIGMDVQMKLHRKNKHQRRYQRQGPGNWVVFDEFTKPLHGGDLNRDG